MDRLMRAISHQHTLSSRRLLGSHLRCSYRYASTQLLYRPTGEAVRFQSVRFKKPGIFSLQRIAKYALYTGATAGCLTMLMRYLDLEIEFIDEEELGHSQDKKQARDGAEEKGSGEGDDGPFYADEDSLFIPLTWSRKAPRTFYRGSDPEWQEFIKVARDKPRHERIQQELVRIVSSECSQHPVVRRQIGKDAVIGKYWLDISFPDGPPPEYERSGIEIGDDFIAWSQQKITPENQWRVVRALWPEAAAGGVWAATTTFAGIQYRRIKQALGWEGKDPNSPEEKYRQMMEIIQKRQQQTQERDGQVSKAHTAPHSTQNDLAASRTSSPGSTDTQKRLPWHVPVHLPNPAADFNGKANESSFGIPIAVHMFRHTLSKAWNPKGFEPPRGALVVQGLVELRGATGRMLLDVQSAYDPRNGKFVRIIVGVRNFKKWTQSPRGGP